MAYLLCRNCSGYFKLEANESPHDYETCSCGGQLRYLKSIRSFCEDLKADIVEVDNSAILHDRLQGFKDRLNTETIDSEIYDDYLYDDLEEEYSEYPGYAYSETYEEIVDDLGYISTDNQLYADNESPISSLNDLVNIPEEPDYSPYEDIFPENQIKAPEMDYQYEEVQSDYFDQFSNYDQKSNSLNPKNYFKNHAITLLGFSILPLEYYYLFGSIPYMVMVSFVITVPIILFYLPRTSEIRSHRDVQKICALWALYYIIFGIILLSWMIITQRQFEVLYL